MTSAGTAPPRSTAARSLADASTRSGSSRCGRGTWRPACASCASPAPRSPMPRAPSGRREPQTSWRRTRGCTSGCWRSSRGRDPGRRLHPARRRGTKPASVDALLLGRILGECDAEVAEHLGDRLLAALDAVRDADAGVAAAADAEARRGGEVLADEPHAIEVAEGVLWHPVRPAEDAGPDRVGGKSEDLAELVDDGLRDRGVIVLHDALVVRPADEPAEEGLARRRAPRPLRRGQRARHE